MTVSAQCLRISTILGSQVYNRAGQELGEIVEVVLALEKHAIGFVIMNFSQWAGFKNKLFALPYSALQYDPAQKHFLLNMDKAQLKHAKGFDKKHWPNLDDPVWAESAKVFFGKPGLL